MKPVYFFNPSYDEMNINFYNSGLISIASHLKRKGIPAYVYMNYLDKRFTKDKDYDLVLEDVLRDEPEYIGISCMTAQYVKALDLTRRVKELSPETPVIWGGHHVNAYARELEDNPYIDYRVVGFGELEAERIYRKDDVPLDSVFDYPLDFSTVLGDTAVERSMRGRMVKQASIISSYGCPYRCRFCTNASRKTPLVYRNVRAVVSEIRQVLNMGANSIAFYDDFFFAKESRVIELLNLLAGEGITFPWLSLSRIDTIATSQELPFFRANGCEEIHFGVESGSQRMIDIINKKIKVDSIIPTFQKVLDADILPRASFIIGMPRETIDDVKQTIWLMMTMAEQFGNRFVINTFFFYPVPNTPMTLEVSAGLTVQDYIDAAKYSVHPHKLFNHFAKFYDFLPDKRVFAECWYIARVISEICAPYKYYEGYKPDFKEWGLSVSQETYNLLNKDRLSQKWLDKVREF